MAAAGGDGGTKKRKVRHNAQLQTWSIPNDIIVEILSWLPASSLLRLTWVCKYWFDLITRNTDFIKLHLNRSISINPHNPSVLVTNPLCKQYLSHKLLKYYYIDSTIGFFARRIRIHVNPTILGTCIDFIHFRILGSCHGLVLFSCSPTSFPHQPHKKARLYCIWNPCTKEYKKLPNSCRFLYPHDTITFGFGYDRSIDNYKVVRNVYSYKGITSQVYTLGTNSWRNIGSNPRNLLPRGLSWGNAVYVMGALYWIGYSNDKIISFDIEKERYEEISNQPPACCFGLKVSLKLEVFEGSLCLMLYTTKDIEMWVMKKESSWTKLFNIRRSFHNVLKPLKFTTKGEILLLDSGKCLFLCDPKDNTTTTTIFKRTGGRSRLEDHGEAVYIESLVSLNSGTYTLEDEPN